MNGCHALIHGNSACIICKGSLSDLLYGTWSLEPYHRRKGAGVSGRGVHGEITLLFFGRRSVGHCQRRKREFRDFRCNNSCNLQRATSCFESFLSSSLEKNVSTKRSPGSRWFTISHPFAFESFLLVGLTEIIVLLFLISVVSLL